jgi:hypothetical protein
MSGNQRQKGINERLRLAGCLIHLPIGGNESFT